REAYELRGCPHFVLAHRAVLRDEHWPDLVIDLAVTDEYSHARTTQRSKEVDDRCCLRGEGRFPLAAPCRGPAFLKGQADSLADAEDRGGPTAPLVAEGHKEGSPLASCVPELPLPLPHVGKEGPAGYDRER